MLHTSVYRNSTCAGSCLSGHLSPLVRLRSGYNALCLCVKSVLSALTALTAYRERMGKELLVTWTGRRFLQLKESKIIQGGRRRKMRCECQEAIKTNRCQMRLQSVTWTGIAHNITFTEAHYPAKALA